MTALFRTALLFLAGLTPLLAEVTALTIVPKATDPAIGDEFNSPHGVYLDRNIVVDQKAGLPADRHQLLLFLPGTNGSGTGAKAFCQLGAELGYHVINLTYPTKIPATVCGNDENPKAFAEFRLALIEGGKTKHITIERPDSIEHRLVKLLTFLASRRPQENWAQFLNTDQSIKWETIAVAGQSQGGGHAALIALRHRVARAVCTGAPKDYSKRLDAPAAWYGDPSATPKALIFTFNHRQDPQGCTPAQLLKNLSALKLDEFGPPIDVATEPPPYRHSRSLLTSFPVVADPVTPGNPSARTAHTSVISDANAARWKAVWTYMLTEPAP
ncbi:MAG: hypothetical protein NTV51_19605 [Verrucomicrobia bacterium]|nr:hypothetical protein [Verrucomicrobiota bacterium]